MKLRDEPACKPGSVPHGGGDHPSATAIAGGLPLGLATQPCDLPGSSGGQPSVTSADARRRPLGLAPGGVCRAATVTNRAVVSYTAVSPLPGPGSPRGTVSGRFVFCGTVPRVTPGGRYPPPRPVEPGLSSACAAITRPTRPIGHSMPRSPQPRTRHPARHNARREPATRHECHARQCGHGRAPQSGRHHESC